jgi:hypothetical protein
MRAVTAIAVFGVMSAAYAQQGYINPGPMPPFNGDYVITTPGQPDTFVNRDPITGGHSISTPGQRPFIQPSPLNPFAPRRGQSLNPFEPY